MRYDARKLLLEKLNKQVTACITVCRAGMLAGMDKALIKAEELGLYVQHHRVNGDIVEEGDTILIVRGSPWQMVQAEDNLIGLISKSSGIATAASLAIATAGDRFQVVSGAWKKIPPENRLYMREAVRVAGMLPRLVDKPFIYLDKNIVRSCGGIFSTLELFRGVKDKIIAIQIRGETCCIAQEAIDAWQGGAGIVMIDTGRMEDIKEVSSALNESGARAFLKIAFSGGVNLQRLKLLKDYDVDIIDMGVFIVDAPLLDLKLDIITCNY